jgi:hypothetical protein
MNRRPSAVMSKREQRPVSGRECIMSSHMPTSNQDFLQAALGGYLHHLAEINRRIAELRGRLGNMADGAAAPPKKGTMTLAGRRRIAAAQRRRWRETKQAKAEPEKLKRKLSAAARKRIGDAARKRWALLKANQKGKRRK